MLRSTRFLRSWFLLAMVALTAGWILVAQQPRRVDDALLKTGSKTGEEWIMWDPIARKERWRAPGAGAGPFTGGSLSTAGNLVFSSVNNRLLVFRADTGEKLLDLDLHTSQMGPPISFMIDGKQYISVAGGPAGGGGFGGGGGRGAAKAGDAPAPPPQPAHLLLLTLDGKAPIPGAPGQ